MTSTEPTSRGASSGAARSTVSLRITLTGIVQGVGFRPFVHRLATGLGLSGIVGNDTSRVFIEVHGDAAVVDRFVERLVSDAPPLAHVDLVTTEPMSTASTPSTSSATPDGPTAGNGAGASPVTGGFRIVESRDVAGARTLVPPDTAVCDDCVAELLDPADRRHRHPFITCTNCGPRFTIIRDLPYDRPSTTMAGFDMCPACAAEYADPADRRYHAQPIGCHDCGPRLAVLDADGGPVGGDPLAVTADVLRSGGTVAVKGLGGFHLAVDATDHEAVDRLRRRKYRPDKPFAVMVRDLDAARRLAHVGDDEAGLLASPAHPIVLLRARGDSPCSPSVAPANPLIGVVLAYTPVHHLLLADLDRPLVMTSGNRAGEPIVHRDDEVVDRLGVLCDLVLTHDRPIHLPCDDSVVRVVGGAAGPAGSSDPRLLPIRRARGYAPVPVALEAARRTVLAVGGELKNTACVAGDGHAWVSQHVGDMEDLETLHAFEAIVGELTRFYDVTPEVVAVDAHPGYATAGWARREAQPTPVLEVQHHHAHVAAVMAEHGLDPHEPVLGVAFDGTGYGDDGTIWGGEVLLATVDHYRRMARLAPVLLPGGDAAVRHPARVALSYLHAAGIPWDDDLAPVAAVGERDRRNLAVQFERGVACVPASSMGRLFDAVASLLGLRHEVTYEAHAAIALEVAAADVADPTRRAHGIGFALDDGELRHDSFWHGIVDDLRAGRAVAEIALDVHLAVADAVVGFAQRWSGPGEPVLLSGGVFQNALLLELCIEGLTAADRVPLTHRIVPPNDGGLSLGQAYIAAHTTRSLDGTTTVQLGQGPGAGRSGGPHGGRRSRPHDPRPVNRTER